MTAAYVALVILLFTFRIWRIVSRAQARTNGSLRSSVEQNLAPPDDPRWQASRGEQLAGRACVDCNGKVVFEDDGKKCATCLEPVHKKKCAKHHRLTAHAPATQAPYR
jgi:hypothetical protein